MPARRRRSRPATSSSSSTSSRWRHRATWRRTSGLNARVLGGRSSAPRSDEGRGPRRTPHSSSECSREDGEARHPRARGHRRVGNHRDAGRAWRLRPSGDRRALGLRRFIRYGIPDVLGTERERYAGRRVLVVGSGHSALNALLDLATLAEQAPDTRVVWVIRRPDTRPAAREARARTNSKNAASSERAFEPLLDAGRLELVTGFRIDRVTRDTRRESW